MGVTSAGNTAAYRFSERGGLAGGFPFWAHHSSLDSRPERRERPIPPSTTRRSASVSSVLPRSSRVSKVQLDKDGKTWSVLDRIKKKHRNSRSREEGVGRGVTKCAHVLLTRSNSSRGAIGSTRLGCSPSFLSLGSSCVCCSSSRDVSSGAGSPDTPRSSASASTSSPSSLSSSILSSACCRLSVCRDQEKPQG